MFAKMKTRTKILGGFGTMIAISAAVGFLAWNRLSCVPAPGRTRRPGELRRPEHA